MRKCHLFNFLSLPIIFMLLVGCGEGSNQSNNSSGNDQTDIINTGIFIDAPVEGLKYTTATQSGYTTAQGYYQYKFGETVTFSIGNLILGSAIGSDMTTPLDFTGETDFDNLSTEVVNIARLLQSLDSEPDNTGKILLPTTLRTLDLSNISGLDLTTESDLNIILNTATNLTSQDYTLVSGNTATSNLKEYIELFNQYETITAGTTSGTGVQYYLLTMPSDGNIVVDTSNIAYLFDTNLNEINYFDDDNKMESGKSVFLSAGTYVIKVSYEQPNDIHKTITINSPSLFNQNNLNTITAGTTSGTGVQYYLLTMPSDGNIVVDTSNSAYLYDTNLNEINYFDDDNYMDYGPSAFLPAGTYVIKVNYFQPKDIKKTITISSSVLSGLLLDIIYY